jgi:8-oxo-dGTP pyrophosphatase MutT (NUDIX family)
VTVGSGLHADAVRTLAAWSPGDRQQESLRQAFLAYLAARPDACARSCEPGHLTASLLLLDTAGERALLTLHPRVGRWLQLGGHCEPDDGSLALAALREGSEESGIDGISVDPRPLHLAVHPITCSLGVPTRHLDVRFLGVAPPDAEPAITPESVDLAWWPIDDLPHESRTIDDLGTQVALAIERLSALPA